MGVLSLELGQVWDYKGYLILIIGLDSVYLNPYDDVADWSGDCISKDYTGNLTTYEVWALDFTTLHSKEEFHLICQWQTKIWDLSGMLRNLLYGWYCLSLNYDFKLELIDFQWRSSAVEPLPALCEFYNRNAMKRFASPKISSIDAMLNLKFRIKLIFEKNSRVKLRIILIISLCMKWIKLMVQKRYHRGDHSDTVF